MKRIPAYDRHPYWHELETEIVRTGTENHRPYAVLRDTVLFPEGGGQPGDRGWLAGNAVEEVRQEGGEIRHYLESPVQPGPVLVTLDWGRRFDHMQQHTGQHLLTALAEDRFGWSTTAFHLGQEVADIELAVPQLPPDQFQQLEELANAMVREGRRVRVRRVNPSALQALRVRTRGLPADHRGPVRLVEIDGLDLNTCGGTHVKSTAELEAVKLLSTEPMRGGTRLYFVTGSRLRRRLQGHEERAAELRALLGVPDREFSAAVKNRAEQLHEFHQRERIWRDELATLAAEALSSRTEEIVDAHFRAGDPAFLQHLAHRLLEASAEKAALLTAGSEGEGFFAVVVGDQVGCDTASLGRQVALLLAGRGGGTGRIFQGKASAISKRKDALGLFQLELERD
jgi:Ser-tRNA(Ala) deacylase AlaX/fructose-specific component phosphotransferase system IIB-like protein